MQYDGTGHFFHQGKHMVVIWRVTDLVHHTIHCMGIVDQPLRFMHCEACLRPLLLVALLRHHQGDVVVLGKSRQQFGAIVGDTCTLRWQRRNKCKLGLDAFAQVALQRRLRNHDSFERLHGALGRLVPREQTRLLQGVYTLGLEKLVIAQRFGHLGRDRGDVEWIEQCAIQPDYFRQAGCVGSNHRRTTCHCFQRRKAEALVPRRENEQLAQVV
ncbi:hypothetical protein D3C81_1483410 [compost metagenome]